MSTTSSVKRRVREDAREVDEFVEHIEQCSPLRAAATGDHFAAFALALHQVLGDDDRFDDEHVVLFEQDGDFVADRRERGELDFDELFAADDVDAVAAEALFDESAVDGVVLLSVGGGVKFPYFAVDPRRLAGG